MSLRRRLVSLGLLGVLVSAGLWQASRIPCWQLVGNVTCRVETDLPVVALTFDDGPTTAGVDAVLNVLNAYGVRATFFLIGQEAAQRPELVRRLVAAGHEVGNHSWSHRRMVGRLPAFHAREIADTDASLRSAGATPVLFRPPYGKRLIGLPLAVERAGYRMVTWDVDDGGLESLTPEAYAEALLAEVKPGSIILMHPMYGANGTARAALPILLDGLAARGYRVTTVSEALETASRA